MHYFLKNLWAHNKKKLKVQKWRQNHSQSPVFGLAVLFLTGSEISRFCTSKHGAEKSLSNNFLLYLWVLWGDLFKQLKKSVINTEKLKLKSLKVWRLTTFFKSTIYNLIVLYVAFQWTAPLQRMQIWTYLETKLETRSYQPMLLTWRRSVAVDNQLFS